MYARKTRVVESKAVEFKAWLPGAWAAGEALYSEGRVAGSQGCFDVKKEESESPCFRRDCYLECDDAERQLSLGA